MSQAFLPTSRKELDALGIDQPDIIFVTGDAYIDHPSFAMAILGRVLEAAGFTVAILAQPPWKDCSAFKALGPPRLMYAVSAGNMDSMINHYTANRKPRSEDAYSPGGRKGLRPDRPTNVYAQRCREAYPGIPVVVGGVEASLRRIAHYDYWSDTVRPSILVTSKADLCVFGMGERSLRRIAERLRQGEDIRALRDLRGVAYLLGAKEPLPDHRWDDAPRDNLSVPLPSFEEVKADKEAFVRMTKLFHHETNPWSGRRLTQAHGGRLLVVNPPDLPLSTEELDACYDLPYRREPHPRYKEPIPAFQTIKDSIQVMRGCFGGCTFCSITMHQGRPIQSRSEASILKEVRQLTERKDFKGHISDLGGPTANMYRMHCKKPEVEQRCRRLSCIHPTICKLLDTSHSPIRSVMRKARQTKGIKRVHIASGIRTDLAKLDQAYLDDIAAHHTGGHLKVAPEHASDRVLALMKKPGIGDFEIFKRRFEDASHRAGREQYLVPYFIGSHPGSSLEDMVELALFLKRQGLKPKQVQDFIPAPMDLATCMYYTGIDPISGQEVPVAKKARDRKHQRALMQFFKPENWFEVHEALTLLGRTDLIGKGKDCLIPEKPPKAAREKRNSRR